MATQKENRKSPQCDGELLALPFDRLEDRRQVAANAFDVLRVPRSPRAMRDAERREAAFPT
jgi:hypothetical protein